MFWFVWRGWLRTRWTFHLDQGLLTVLALQNGDVDARHPRLPLEIIDQLNICTSLDQLVRQQEVDTVLRAQAIGTPLVVDVVRTDGLTLLFLVLPPPGSLPPGVGEGIPHEIGRHHRQISDESGTAQQFENPERNQADEHQAAGEEEHEPRTIDVIAGSLALQHAEDAQNRPHQEDRKQQDDDDGEAVHVMTRKSD